MGCFCGISTGKSDSGEIKFLVLQGARNNNNNNEVDNDDDTSYFSTQKKTRRNITLDKEEWKYEQNLCIFNLYLYTSNKRKGS